MLEMMLAGQREVPFANLVAGTGGSPVTIGYNAGAFGTFDSSELNPSFFTNEFISQGVEEAYWEFVGITGTELSAYDLYVDEVYVPWSSINSNFVSWAPPPEALKFVDGQTYKIELR